MKPATSNTISSSVSSEIFFGEGEARRPLVVRRSPLARRTRLAIDPRTGDVRLTLPRRASERQARAWAETHRAWIEAQIAKLPKPRRIAPGATIPFRGDEVLVDWSPDHSRVVRLEGDRLRVGGPIEAVPRRVVAWLRREALKQLETETRAIASEAGVTVGRVAIGDPKARWGSCSANGDIRYSWRLILAPPFVLTSTVAHEVAHRLHMDHSPAFRAAEKRLYGRDPRPARDWLKQHGAGLYWLG
ncbi:metal-dependent hydrolase [Nostoc sp. 3335mG]|nr:metal-dependent hydrolase [Nostoc sp. 3335mG]